MSLITARPITTLAGEQAYMADGPDGHTSLLLRLTPELCVSDGEAYFLRTRVQRPDGKWVFREDWWT